MARATTMRLTGVAVLALAVPAQADFWFGHRFQQGDLIRIDLDNPADQVVIGNTGVNTAFGFSFSPVAVPGGHDAGTLFGVEQSGGLYTISTTDASTTFIGNTDLNSVESLSFDLNGNLFASRSGQWYSISTVDGSATFLGNLKGVGDIDGLTVTPIAQNVAGLGVVPAGTFFAVDTGSLYTIDPNTLVATFIGSGEASETVAFDTSGTLYSHDFFGQLFSTRLDPISDTLVVDTPGEIASSAIIFASAACFDVESDEVTCHADGSTFTYTVEGTDGCTGGTNTYSFTATGGAVGEQLCFTLLVTDEQGGFCCSSEICVTIPDCTPAALPSDLDGDGIVGMVDFLALLGAWGSCSDCGTCPADFDGDCSVGILDLLILLGNWG